MTRVKATVGTEENLRAELRDHLASRITADQIESFALDLRDMHSYVELDDTSRVHVRTNILSGYSGAPATWEGVDLPGYRYEIMEMDHFIMVTIS